MEFWWIGQRGVDCIGLHRLVPIKGVICCDFGLDSTQIASEVGAEIYSLEKDGAPRKGWSNYSIDEALDRFAVSPHVKSLFESECVAIAYRASPRLESWAKRALGKLIIAAPPAAIVSEFDDKFLCYDALLTAGVAVPKGRIIDPTKSSYRDLSQEFGPRLVLKRQLGASGSGTCFASSDQDYAEACMLMQTSQMLVTEFVEGPSLNIHAVVGANDVLVSAPSVQLVGIPYCTDRDAVYCGNDFSAVQQISETTRARISEETKKIAELMRQQGYRGIFGVDFIGTDERVVALDVNPRFQGSSSLLTQAEINAGIIPTSLYHLLQFVGGLPEPIQGIRDDSSSTSLSGSQLILHSLDDQPRVVANTLEPGGYSMAANGNILFQRSGLSLLDMLPPDEFIVTCGVPRIGTVVEPGAPLVKIITSGSVLAPDLQRLDPLVETIVRRVSERIVFH